MRRWEYIPVVLMPIIISLLIAYPRISGNRAAWETQRRINEKVIEALSGLVETDHVIIEQLTTKKPGH